MVVEDKSSMARAPINAAVHKNTKGAKRENV
jgi:hypothetical protein